MSNNTHNNHHSKNTDPLNYEFTLTPYERFNDYRQPTPPRPGGYLPPTYLQPGGGLNPPPFDGAYNPPPFGAPGGMPNSGPPNYIPSKNDTGVVYLKNASESSSLKAISHNSINICLFKFTYIWEHNGRSYWAYLINIDKVSVSGFKWLGRSWVYFGLDLRKIDSFVCYRNDEAESNTSRDVDDMIESIKEEYFGSEVRDVYSKNLICVDIPEYKNDFIVETIGVVDDKKVKSKTPCMKNRVISYRINLEISYPSTLDDSVKIKLIEYANQASDDALNFINSDSFRKNNKNLNALDLFNLAVSSMTKLYTILYTTFNNCIQTLPNNKDFIKYISIKIVKEKINTKWKYRY